MDASQIAVATVTWARCPEEEQLLSRSLGLVAEAGIPVAVADRGTSSAFTDALRRLPAFSVTVTDEPGLVAQVQASVDLAAATGRRFVLYVEPDKELFFAGPMNAFLRRAPEASDVGVVLASRSAETFETFPPMQRYTEGVINTLCGMLLGVTGDYSYGPVLMNRLLLPHVASLEPDLGWGWRHRTFLAAHRRQLRVLHVIDDYPCPLDQRDEGDVERVHRLRQLSQNILGLTE